MLSDLVQTEFTLTAGFFMVLFNRFTPLGSVSLRVMDEMQSINKSFICIRRITHYKGKAGLLEHNNSIDVFRGRFHVTNLETLNSVFLSSTAL